MFGKLWNAVVEFFRSATFRGMQLGAEDFAKQFEAEARELSGAPPAATPPALAVTVVTAVTQAPAAQQPQKSLPAAKPQAAPQLQPKPIAAVELEQRMKEAPAAPEPPQSNDGYTVPVKRGRGRPRKNPDTPPDKKGGDKC